MSKARRGATAITFIGAGITLVQYFWWLISKWQEVEQLAHDMPRVVRWLGHPRAGPIITIAGVLAFAGIVLADRRGKSQRPVSLIGKFFHTFNAEGRQQFQGRVLREDGSRLFVQLYSALDGEATDQRFLTDAQQQSARFYETHADWIEAFRRLNRS